MRNRAVLLCCAATGAMLASAAQAQTTQADSVGAPENQDKTSGNDIVVTAQRTSQRLQDVPVSVSAFTGQTVQELGVQRISDLFAQTPAVHSQSPAGNAGFPVFNIRGVTTIEFSYTNEPAVAVYADDVYLGNPAFATLQLFDLDRVEVLRGPQGTLYGRNATGGLINYISRRPTAEFSGSVMAQYSSFNDIVVEGAVSGPLAQGVRLRVAGRYNTNDGWQTNQTTGTKFARVDHAVSGRATLEVDLGPKTLLTVSGNYSDTRGGEDGRAMFGARRPTALTVRCTPAEIVASQCVNARGFGDPDPDPRKPFSEQADLPYHVTSAGGLVKLESDLGGVKLTSLTAYQWGRKSDTADVDAAPIAGSNFLIKYFIRHRQFSQELRLSGKVGRLSLMGGGYYYRDNRFYTSTYVVLNSGTYADQKVESYAGYGQASFELTDTINLTAGARYTHDDKNLEDLAAVSSPVPGTRQGTIPAGFNGGRPYTGRIRSSKVTWHAGIDWHVTPDTMLFATASSGYKSGGFNTSLVSAVVAIGPVGQETITTYELGVKSQLFDRMLTFNATGFYSIYDGIQASASIPCLVGDTRCAPGAASFTTFLNIGKAKIYGAEVEVVARPTSDLSISAGLALNHNRLHAAPTVAVGGVALNGKKLANTPKVGLNGSFTWLPSLGEGRGNLIFGADVSYQSDVFFRIDNSAVAVQKAYALLGGRIGYSPRPGLRFEVYGRNIFDKHYFVSKTDIAESAPGTWAIPRQIGIRATGSF